MTGRFVVAGMTALFLFGVGCGEKVRPGQVELKRPAVSGVTVVKVEPSRVDSYYETSGTVQAKTISSVASRVMGAIVAVKVKEGDRVSAGDVLVVLDDRDVNERLRAVEAAYKEAIGAAKGAKERKTLAEVTYRRYRALHEEKVISQQEMDQIETQKKVAEADFDSANGALDRAGFTLEEVRIQQGFTKITAPFSGIITAKKADVGAMAIPGLPLLIAEEDSYFDLVAPVDEKMAKVVKIGMSVYVIISPAGQKMSGTISEIMPSVDPTTRTFSVKTRLRDRSLRSGLYAKLLIPTGTKEAMLIPAKAVVERGQLTGLFSVDGKGLVAYRLIRTGNRYDGSIEVLSGLKGGERIITEGVGKAIDGGIIRE